MAKIIPASEVGRYIHDNDTLWIVSSGGGINDPYKILENIEKSYLENGHPKDLTLCHASGIGDKNGGGSDRFSHRGMTRKVIGSHWVWSPNISRMAANNELEAYTLPQGVMTQLARCIAGGKPGLISHVGLGTYLDPRIEGGKMNTCCKEDLSEVIQLRGQEWMFYKSFPIQVAIMRGTTADEDGNITFEHEGVVLEAVSAAQAAKNSGGIVIVQVKRLTKRGTMDPKMVKVPGILVDYIVVDPNQKQSSITDYEPSFTGEVRAPDEQKDAMPMGARKIVARRAAQELFPGAVVNLGFGIPDGVASVAGEEGISDNITLTVEQGVIGGVPAQGINFSFGHNPQAIIDETYQFDWYDGGGLDLTFLSFAEMDCEGNVNVSKFGGRVVGVGGFANISQNAKKVVFCATFSSSGLEIGVENGKLKILREGRFTKMRKQVEQISFSGKFARLKGQNVMFVTERAVFELRQEGVVLTEIAPGIDLEKDVLTLMDFRPIISDHLKRMDEAIFLNQPMGHFKNFD